MSDAEFLVFLHRLQHVGLGSLDHAIAIAGSDYKWCRQTTIEAWERLGPYMPAFNDAVGKELVRIAQSVLP